MGVTSRDVAERAGCSQSTVSLVLSGKAAGRVGPGTAEAVQRAARELGYRPNVAARALRTGRARAVGLVVPDITNPFFGLLLRGAQRAARRHGYTVVLVDADRDPEERATSVRALQSAAVDGYLTFGPDPPATPRPGEPTVAIEAWEGEAPRVRLDVEGAMEAVVAHLRELGHERIGRLGSVHDQPTFNARARRLTSLLGPHAVELAEHDLDGALAAGLRLLARDVTAVVCDADVLAGGLYLAARESGLRIPDDVSVVGFDDLDVARVLDPPLTTVAVHPEAFGATAMERLVAAMAGEEVPQDTVLGAQLVVRASTGPPRVS